MRRHNDIIPATRGRSLSPMRRYVVRGAFPPDPEMPLLDAVPQFRSSTRRRTRLHWNLIWVLIALAAAAWLFRGVKAALSWKQLLGLLGVQDPERFTRLFVLGVVVTALCAILRVLRRR